MERLWGIGLWMGEVRFSLAGGLPCRCRVEWRGHRYALESDGARAVAIADGRTVYDSPCGVRAIADADGRLLRVIDIE